MIVRILGSSPDPARQPFYLTSFLIDGRIAIDAGCLGLHATPADQAPVERVFLTHSHADHTASLPVFLENAAGQPVVYGHTHTIDSLRRDVFNDRVWPDFASRRVPDRPYFELEAIESEQPVDVGANLRLTPIRVDHTVPTYGYLVEAADRAVVFGGDSGPTERLWELARTRTNLSTVFLECSFPDSMRELARVSGHLTPQLVATEVAKLPAGVRIVVVHIKPRWHDEVVAQLGALRIPGLEIGCPDRSY